MAVPTPNNDPRREDFLPDLCSSRAVFAVLLFMQLVALLLLAGREGPGMLGERLLLLSLYLHWIGLCSAAVLCMARPHLAGRSSMTAILASYLLLLLVTGAISEGAWQLARWLDLGHYLPDTNHVTFVLRNLVICLIVSTLALRYFWLQAQWRGQVRAEGEARYQALQARIRPHFLFNSLNSIAALISSRPQAAETAVEDLAQLFRAGLSASDRRVSLADELEVTRAYLRTEGLRLGERLRVNWTVDEELKSCAVPQLCLQPLLENAVIHGIEPRPQGGEIQVSIRKRGEQLHIEVENPLPDAPRPSAGAQTALDNIRQRLALIYREQATLVARQDDDRFMVHMTLPITGSAALP